MQVDLQVAGIGLEITKGVLHLDHVPICLSEKVVAHGHGIVTMQVGGLILKADIGPGVDGKAVVLAIVVIAADKVGKGSFAVHAKLLLCRLGGFKEYRASLKGVEGVQVVFSGCHKIAAIGVGLTNGHNAFTPGLLGLCDLFCCNCCCHYFLL